MLPGEFKKYLTAGTGFTILFYTNTNGVINDEHSNLGSLKML